MISTFNKLSAVCALSSRLDLTMAPHLPQFTPDKTHKYVQHEWTQRPVCALGVAEAHLSGGINELFTDYNSPNATRQSATCSLR